MNEIGTVLFVLAIVIIDSAIFFFAGFEYGKSKKNKKTYKTHDFQKEISLEMKDVKFSPEFKEIFGNNKAVLKDMDGNVIFESTSKNTKEK